MSEPFVKQTIMFACLNNHIAVKASWYSNVVIVGREARVLDQYVEYKECMYLNSSVKLAILRLHERLQPSNTLRYCASNSIGSSRH